MVQQQRFATEMIAFIGEIKECTGLPNSGPGVPAIHPAKESRRPAVIA
jgi:hypothetical protein